MDKWHEPGRPMNRLMPMGWRAENASEIFWDRVMTAEETSKMKFELSWRAMENHLRKFSALARKVILEMREGEEWKTESHENFWRNSPLPEGNGAAWSLRSLKG